MKSNSARLLRAVPEFLNHDATILVDVPDDIGVDDGEFTAAASDRTSAIWRRLKAACGGDEPL